MDLQQKVMNAFIGKVVRKDLAFLVKGLCMDYRKYKLTWKEKGKCLLLSIGWRLIYRLILNMQNLSAKSFFFCLR